MNEKICCITGHRNIAKEKIDYITTQLQCAIENAIENGCTHFISGFAYGVDLMFADIVSQLKIQYPLLLEASIPYQGRMRTPDKNFQRLIKHCDIVKIHSSIYSKNCYLKRNRYMVDNSEIIIAVWDGRQNGGTAYTISYGKRLNKDIKIIKI